MTIFLIALIVGLIAGYFLYHWKKPKAPHPIVKGKYGHLINPFQEVSDGLPSPAPKGYNWELRVERREDGYEYLILGMYDRSIDEVTLQMAACLTYNFEEQKTYQQILDMYGPDETRKNSEKSIVEPILEWANSHYETDPDDYDYVMKA